MLKVLIEGELTLDDEDERRAELYHDEEGYSKDQALLQVAQDRLGHTGFQVDSVERADG